MKVYMKDTIDYYNNNSIKYKELWLDDFNNNYNFEIPDMFLSYLKFNSKILDLGCGTGRDSKYFFTKGYDVTSIDGSSEMCKIASDLLKKEVKQINFLDIDYKNVFDGIFACASLLHLSSDDLLIVLKKISIALKENGILYTCFKYGDNTRVDSGRFYNDMTDEKFNNILNNIENLKIIKSWITKQYKSDIKFINFIIVKNK